MSAVFEDYGYTVANVKFLMSMNLHTAILQVLCHGIHTCIFAAALHYIAQSTQPNQKRIILAGIIAFLWSANTIIVGLGWKYADNQFISHGVSLEDEFDFDLYEDTSMVLAVGILRVLNTILADLILIWRCWVLYGGSRIVVAIPSLCLITETISACFVIAVSVNNAIVGANQVNWSLVYYSTTVVTNSLCTFLILFRIVRVSGVGTSLKTYRGIIEILVESAAMYAVIYIALLVASAYEFYTYSKVAPATESLITISYSITGIAPTLIIARVMAGHSRPHDSWTRPSLPHLRTPMRSIAESLQFASAPNHSVGTQSTTADNNIEQARDLDVADDGRAGDGDVREAEASEAASHDKSAEVNSSDAKV